MKVKCDYCRQLIDEGEKNCPFCGASMPTSNRVASKQPKSIEELRQWYVDHNLPPEKTTRFFIGKNIKEPKAFGIYKDNTGDFVVYKNKSDGKREIRYQGVDEEYAVNELYQRLKAEIADQKRNNNAKKESPADKALGCLLTPIVFLFSPIGMTALAWIGLVLILLFDHSPSSGYYRYQGNDYYYQGSSWYVYNAMADDWERAANGSELDEIINDDTDDDYRVYDHYGKRFEDSTWYDTGDSDDDDDWDSDSTWDSGDSWDSDSTDWDSDW
ncbi:MAG: zinc ribbon domain-containing protein [Lachnospiraceae bacterium]|nr:zinc ribbon domain-containing protein [Lachnospiraceae bacterium]